MEIIVSALPTTSPKIDPGKLRGLQRVASEDGFLEICAFDHLSDFAELLAPDPKTVSFEEVVAAKDAIVRALSSSVSAFLLDARYGLHTVATGALARSVGLMVSVEDEDYAIPPGPRRTRLRTGWSPRQMKLVGADAAKLLWFYRPDGDPATAEHQRQVVRDLAGSCEHLSLPLIVEPIWYPLPGEDTSSEAWKVARVDGIIASASVADELGADVLKVEFPGYVGTDAGAERSVAACKQLDDVVNKPWAILSAGVNYEQFKLQLQIACQAGGSGYLAGRSVWRDAVSIHDPAKRGEAIAAARRLLDGLNDITRKYGRPLTLALPLPEVLTGMPDGWFQSWHSTV
jgi:tagatose 1,6-diphosphate aldolase